MSLKSMTPERHQKIQQIFEAVFDLPPARRAAYLDEVCGTDSDLHSHVARLIAAAGDIETETEALRESRRPSSSSPEEGRFPAGTVLAGRYRILGLLGHGGMGEVYRAYDLILNQAVALKFLAGGRMSESALARFRNEVRIARQVSHPNVCRVYDIGFIEGLHFLSMEYLDGEDLDFLLRRIGRLPQDKAIEFARKICAGLAAAHERGVLHRDLKPSNIMIDGRGQVRITDFGLAVVATELSLRDVRSGTPAYMSPEQKAGKDVTTRSDLYSLGLVLYEMFTGKRRTSPTSNPSDLVKDLDPTIERVILRCLEEEPKRRPSSALAVAMALPGGDPIAAALAAGEIPSPEMVAASEEKDGFSTRTAMLCFLAGVVLLLATNTLMYPKLSVFGPDRAEIVIPPEALAFRANDILRQLGYTEQPQSTAYGFDCCDAPNLRFVEKQGARRDALLASHQPPVIRFWYRQHQSQFLADPSFSAITYDLPANVEPEMVRLALDAKGRLIALEARPRSARAAVQGTEAEHAFDWGALFAVADLNPARFTPVPPVATPPMAFDARAAWIGTYAADRPEQVRIEAAAWLGRPVYFDIAGDWHRQSELTGPPRPVLTVLAFLGVCAVGGAALLAWRNLRLGRGDRKGAQRIAVFVFLCFTCVWVLGTAHVASLWEIRLLFVGISEAGFASGLVWLAYLAIEPYARRHWPDSLISWNRLLAGRLRDPLVASHVLVGFCAFWAAAQIVFWVYAAVSAPPIVPFPTAITALDSTTHFAAGLLAHAGGVPALGMAILVLVILLRLLLRRVEIADPLTAALLALSAMALDFSNPYRFVATWAACILFFYAFLWVLRRFGLLAVMTMCLMNNLALATPFTPYTSWYAARVLVSTGIMVAIAAWALWVILSAKRGPGSATAES
ncbi:MAG TPA: serine/threonine-protein kinase [Bryobacteraceae bacterium]|jgi:hypothetical protein|nr:serine/threonine-protein kinase [Bryobacteraceae bacterium]